MSCAGFKVEDLHRMPIAHALHLVCYQNPFSTSDFFKKRCESINVVILADLLAYVFNPSDTVPNNIRNLLSGGLEMHVNTMLESIIATHDVLSPGLPVYVTWIEDGVRKSYDCVMGGSPLGSKPSERDVVSADGSFEGRYLIDLHEDEITIAWNKACFQGDSLVPIVPWGGGRYKGSITVDGRPHGEGELQTPTSVIKGKWSNGQFLMKTRDNPDHNTTDESEKHTVQ